MANEIIKPHKFEVAKNNIHSLSKTLPNVSLQKFETKGGFFGWFNHKVTGDEINSFLVSPMQSILISQNSKIKELFNIADEVYKALESLDNEYIQAIIVAVKSAEIASEQAKTASGQALEASRKALDASSKATTAQADIKRTIEALQITVKILKEFKEKVTKDLSSIASLNTRITSVNSKIQDVENKICGIADSAKKIKDFQPILSNLNYIKELHGEINKISTHLESYLHLGDIDAIWSDVEGHKTDLVSFHQQVDTFVEKVNQATARINVDIEALKQDRTFLESYVDAICSDVESHKTDLASFHQQVDAFVEKVNQAAVRIDVDIEALKQYRTLLESYQHLGDVDAIWSDVEGHKTNLAGLHKQVDDFISEVHSVQKSIKESIENLERKNDTAHYKYEKRIKIAYYIGGSAVGLSVVNYILQLLGIL